MGSLISLSNSGRFELAIKGIFVVGVGPTIVLCVFPPLGGEGGNNFYVLSFEEGKDGRLCSPIGGD